MHKIFDRSDANSACRACFSRWNTHGRAWRHRSSCRASSDPFPSSPFFHSEFSFLENRAVSLSPPLPLILKLQIERDIRVLFRRMSRWKRSRRDSRPQHPRYYPRLSPDSTNPRQGLNPTQPRPKIRRVTRQAAARLGARGIPPSPSTPFSSAFSFIPINIPLPAFFAPLPTTLSRTPAFLRQRSLPLPLLLPYSALIRVSAPSIPTLPTNPAPFLCNLSAAFVSLFTPLLPLPNSSSSTSSGGNAATLPFSSL